MEIEREFFQAGARYRTGSGANVFGRMPEISLHRGIELLTRVGLPHRQAIAAPTSNFPRLFRWPDIGIMEPGGRADLLALSENPVAEIRNPRKIHHLLL